MTLLGGAENGDILPAIHVESGTPTRQHLAGAATHRTAPGDRGHCPAQAPGHFGRNGRSTGKPGEGLDLCAAIQLELLEELRRDQGECIHDLRGYAAVLCYRACSDYWRAKRPERTSLGNQVRYFLQHQPGFAVWPTSGGDLLCGFSSWKGRQEGAIAVERLRRIDQERRAALPRKPRAWMKPEDWQQLFTRLFEYLEAPLPLDDLTAGLADLLGVRESQGETAEELGREWHTPPASDPLVIRESLERLWQEITQLRPRQRCAYLLNFRDGELDVFPENGVASIRDIGAAVALTGAQFVRLWEELPLDPAQRQAAVSLRSDEEKFAVVWNHLPLEDLLISRLLDATRQQVINLRKVARERILRQMQAYRGKKW
jgi:hypothetical protein